ncbi:MAG: long-chain fatty acid--CoA ligase [Candidatus Jacksonbacteria bacterium]|nr:long-chain fatty acid--CoA ligase [Candidatus Jacksonbacteria bacterium]
MTVPDLIFQNAAHHPNAIAIANVSEDGYRAITFCRLRKRALRFAEGLLRLGVKGSDAVAIFSENRPEWVIADLAIQMLGAITVPIHSVFNEKYIAHILNDCRARILIASDNHLFEKLHLSRERLPVERIIYFSKNKIMGIHENRYLFFRELAKKVKGDAVQFPARYASDIATIIYTSGTTGAPKGVALTHENIISNIEAIRRAIPVQRRDRFLSILPLSHVFERTAGCYVPLASGARIVYGESARNQKAITRDLKRARPTILLGVPRVFEKAYDNVLSHKFFPLLERMPFKRAIWSYVIKKRFGGAIRLCISGGAALGPPIGEFFHARGLTILEGYGLTETSPVISCNRETEHVFGSCGIPLDNVAVKIAGDGEILVKGPSVMLGYYKLPSETSEVFTGDGFFKTGDLGLIDELGFLHITGRKKSIIVLSTGKNVQPEAIETALDASPYIAQAIAVGEGRKMVTAIIAPEYDKLKDDCIEKKEDAHSRIQNEIDRLLADFPEHERIKKITLLDEPFSVERDELTPTLKLKRKVIEERYKEIIEEMYSL